MVIEWLEFKVVPKFRERFIQIDREVWTATLEKYPGFLGKEVWLDPNKVDRVFLVIRWQTREQWKSIPQAILAETEREFSQQMGSNKYKSVGMKEYQIRKFKEM